MSRSMFLMLLSFCAAFSTHARQTNPSTVGEKAWNPLFAADLSDATFPEGVWSVTNGLLTATEDQNIWTEKTYNNFVLQLDFKTAEGTNSGVIINCSDIENWIPNSVEIQIADDFAEVWANSPKSWQSGAIFGHKPASESVVKHPGEWNHYVITKKNHTIDVELNEKKINHIDLRDYTSAKTNPDGTKVPGWLNKPLSSLPTTGRIGLQGKHAGADVWFKNLRIKELAP